MPALTFDEGAEAVQWGNKVSLSHVARASGHPRAKQESRLGPHSCTEINAEWITDPNVKRKPRKLPLDVRGENRDDPGCGDAFADTAAETRSVREIVGAPDALKLNSCSANDHVRQ